MAKFLLLAVLGAVLFVSNCLANETDIQILEEEIENRMGRIKEIAAKINNTITTYNEMTEERISSINYLHASVLKDIEKTSKEATITGVQRRRWFMNYECLVNAAKKARANLDKNYGNYPADMAKLIEENAGTTLPFVVVANQIQVYLKELYEAKKKEIMRTSDPNIVKKILQQLVDDLRVVDQTCMDLESKVFQLTFSFFENFVKISYTKETALRQVATQDIPKISKCM